MTKPARHGLCHRPECRTPFTDTSPNQQRLYCCPRCKQIDGNRRRRLKSVDYRRPEDRTELSPQDTARLHQLLAHEQAGTRPPRVHLPVNHPHAIRN